MSTDMINKPPHYNQGGIECIDAIRAAMSVEEFKGFLRGNILKYIWRAQRKGDVIENLQKASWYVSKLIEFEQECLQL